MLKSLLHWYELRTNSIINIYYRTLSTKAKGHTSKSTSIFPPKDDISIRSNSIGSLKSIKKGKTIKKNYDGDLSKNIKTINPGIAKNRKNNLKKIFSLLEPGPLMTDASLCEKESKICRTVRAVNENPCSSKNYRKIMAATRDNREDADDTFDYEKYHEDCDSEKERLRGFRKWNETKLGQNFKRQYPDSSLFTILSYNILAQNLLESHAYLYRTHDPRALSWSHRVQKILEEIISHNAEIICLQEVQEDHLAYLTQTLIPLNYKYIYKKRTLNNTDGSAIFYKSNMFTMLDFKMVEYFRPNMEILSRGNVGIVVKFKLKDGLTKDNNKQNKNSDIVVATTHLLYNPKRSDVRLAQVQMMLAELDKMAYAGVDSDGEVQYLPIILTGDFNLQPHTAVYELLTKGVLQYSDLTYRRLQRVVNGDESAQGYELLPTKVGINDNCQYVEAVKKRLETHPDAANASTTHVNRTKSGLLLQALNLTSSYCHITNKTHAQASTFQNEWVTVDYIFYSHGSHNPCGNNSVGHLNLLARFELPTLPECSFLGQIPNLVFGSDHLLLAAKFLFSR